MVLLDFILLVKWIILSKNQMVFLLSVLLEGRKYVRITMESHEEKQKLMSSLWRLKNGPEKFRKISITDDYTQEERREIKRWVDEAKRRTQEVDDGYVWKVRGSPRSKLRLVNMRI